jgi:hypothetical protein
MPPSHSPREVEEWLDREIASLRQLVEGEAPAPSRVSTASRPRPYDHIPPPALRPPSDLVVVLRRARRFVGKRRLDIVLFGLSIGLALVVVWLVLRMTQA